MIEKVGHIKNPLTVIAVFAGLAEVSGTATLPFIEKDIQYIFVWFLMLFPCLLVLLLFYVLVTKHHTLYAPSDFQDDKTFSDLFVYGSDADRTKKLNEEISVATESDPSKQNVQNFDGLTPGFERNLRANALLAEELAIAKIGKDLGIQFQRNQSLKGAPNILIDGVHANEDQITFIEVKYSKRGFIPTDTITRTFEQINRVITRIPYSTHTKPRLVFAVVVDDYTDENSEKIKSKVISIASDYPFTIAVDVLSLPELEKEFRSTAE